MESLYSLIQAAQQGDAESFNCIVERFQDMACASAYAMSGNRQLAEDAAQEAFLEAYLTLAKLREPAAFSSWFRSILFKQVDRLTRGKHLVSSPLEAVAERPGEEQDLTTLVETHEVNEQVHRAIATLPERERLVVFLFYGTGYALKEIAAFLEVHSFCATSISKFTRVGKPEQLPMGSQVKKAIIHRYDTSTYLDYERGFIWPDHMDGQQALTPHFCALLNNKCSLSLKIDQTIAGQIGT
jgi:RNA polymerase sigma factor (sigma-70 family)